MSSAKDIGAFTKRESKQTITSHRLAVLVLIRDFFKLRDDSNIILSKRDTRDFCLLIGKLIQNPDISLKELQSMLTSGKYTIDNQLVLRVNETLDTIHSEGTGGLMNFVSDLGRLILRDSELVSKAQFVQIHKNSVVGYYLRRFLINFDKLTFSEVTMVYGAFRRYYAGQERMESCYVNADHETLSYDDKLLNQNQWPRRQAQLFIAHQAALINSNVEKAVNPQDLHKHIKNLLKSNPDLAEAHFLNYLNCLRVKDICTAISSLYHCFDRSGTVEPKGSIEEKSKAFRFAALNLAILYCHFGHREESLAALKEAIMLAQEANDNVCLQHALSWLYCLSNTNKDQLLKHSILKSLDLNLTYLVSLGIQSFVQYAGMSGGTPKHIFETLTRSDMVNCQHTYSDLACNSYAQKAGMWLFYGKTEMSLLWSQLLLHLNSENNVLGKAYFGESLCESLCNIANQLLVQGEYGKAYAILALARDRFPSEPICHIWMLCENLFTFVRSLHHEEWVEAEAAAQKIAVYDIWESHLRLAELYLHKRDFACSQKHINEILNGKNLSTIKLRVDYHVRAVILMGEIQYITSYPHVVPPTSLNLCVGAVNDFHVDYLGSIVYLHLANIQLLMGMPAQALKLLDHCFLYILTHGGNYDRARATLLYVKCILANSSHFTPEDRRQVILDAAQMLHKVNSDFTKVEAYARIKEVLYLQALLYNEVKLTKERNKCSLEYRLLDEEHPSKNDTILIAML